MQQNNRTQRRGGNREIEIESARLSGRRRGKPKLSFRRAACGSERVKANKNKTSCNVNVNVNVKRKTTTENVHVVGDVVRRDARRPHPPEPLRRLGRLARLAKRVDHGVVRDLVGRAIRAGGFHAQEPLGGALRLRCARQVRGGASE